MEGLSWQVSLARAIFGEQSIDKLSGDQLAGLDAALEILTERERDMLVRRYQGATLSGIAEFYGVSRERIRQIEAKSLRKLRNPRRSSLIKYGLEGYQKRQSEESTETSCCIDGVEFSVRSYHCLRRAGLNSLEDIIKYDKEVGLESLRNIGTKAVAEIRSKIYQKTLKGGEAAKELPPKEILEEVVNNHIDTLDTPFENIISDETRYFLRKYKCETIKDVVDLLRSRRVYGDGQDYVLRRTRDEVMSMVGECLRNGNQFPEEGESEISILDFVTKETINKAKELISNAEEITYNLKNNIIEGNIREGKYSNYHVTVDINHPANSECSNNCNKYRNSHVSGLCKHAVALYLSATGSENDDVKRINGLVSCKDFISMPGIASLLHEIDDCIEEASDYINKEVTLEKIKEKASEFSDYPVELYGRYDLKFYGAVNLLKNHKASFRIDGWRDNLKDSNSSISYIVDIPSDDVLLFLIIDIASYGKQSSSDIIDVARSLREFNHHNNVLARLILKMDELRCIVPSRNRIVIKEYLKGISVLNDLMKRIREVLDLSAMENGYDFGDVKVINFWAYIKALFPDAIYSYTPAWLRFGKYDVFIPSLNKVINYKKRAASTEKGYSDAASEHGLDYLIWPGNKPTPQKMSDFLCENNIVKSCRWVDIVNSINDRVITLGDIIYRDQESGPFLNSSETSDTDGLMNHLKGRAHRTHRIATARFLPQKTSIDLGNGMSFEIEMSVGDDIKEYLCTDTTIKVGDIVETDGPNKNYKVEIQKIRDVPEGRMKYPLITYKKI